MKKEKCKKIKANVIDIKSSRKCDGCCNCNKRVGDIKILSYKLDDNVETDSTTWTPVTHNFCVKPKKSIVTISLSANGTGNTSNQTSVLFRVSVNGIPNLFSATPQIIFNNGDELVNMWNLSMNGSLSLCPNQENIILIEWRIDNDNNSRCAKINAQACPEKNNYSFYLQHH